MISLKNKQKISFCTYLVFLSVSAKIIDEKFCAIGHRDLLIDENLESFRLHIVKLFFNTQKVLERIVGLEIH